MFPLLVSCGGSFQIKNIYDQSSGPDDLDDLGYQMRSQRPEFVLRDSGNVSAILGKPATLNCRVRNVGNKTVRDLEMMTRELRLEIDSCFQGFLDPSQRHSSSHGWEIHLHF